MVLDFQQQLWVLENNVVMCIELGVGGMISNRNCYSRIQRRLSYNRTQEVENRRWEAEILRMILYSAWMAKATPSV